MSKQSSGKGDKKNESRNEILYGAHPIIEMLKAKRRKLISLYTTKPLPKAWERLAPYLPKSVPNIQYVTRATLDKMAGTTEHMGVVAWVSPFVTTKKMFDPVTKPFILVLDSVQDVRNFGAILRSAYCTGVHGVVVCKKDAAPFTPAVFKASAGLAEHLDVMITPSLAQAINDLKKAGYHFYMAVLNGQDAQATEFKKPVALVIGNEAVGISDQIKKQGTAITLAQKTPDISYNASVAAGILMFLVSSRLGVLTAGK